VARRQGCTAVAARQRVARALAQLRARLAGEFGDRASWCLALVRFAAASGAAGGNAGVLAAGGVFMGTKIALAAGGCALLATLWWGLAREPRGATAGATGLEEAAVAVSIGPSEARSDEVSGGDSGAGFALTPAPGTGRREATDVEGAARLFGRVTDTRGRPLEKAVVELLRGTLDETEDESRPVGPDGRFEIGLGEARSTPALALSVSCPGFLSERVEGIAGENLLIALRALPGFAGALVDEDGARVAPPGRVSISVEERPDGTRTEHEAEIAPDGSFSFTELSAGRVSHLWARARGHAHRELEPDLELVPDRVQRMDVELPAGALVTGVVLDETTRAPVPGALVWLESRDYEGENSLHPSTIADALGRFRLSGAEVEYYRSAEQELALFYLLGQAQGYVPSPARAYGAEPNAEQEYEFELALTRSGASLRLRVLRPDGSPAARAQVLVRDSQGNYVFEAADERGLFSRDDLPAGPLALCILGERASGNLDLALEAGETLREELVLQPDRARIHGRVTDELGRPVEVELTLSHHLVVPNLVVAYERHTTRSDAAGRYSFGELPAGRFELRPAVRDCSLPDRATLETRDDQSLEADFIVGPCMVVEGRVEPGSTAPDLLGLELRDPRTGSACATTSPAADGSFRFDPRFEGRYDLVLLLDETELDRTSVSPSTNAEIVLRVPR